MYGTLRFSARSPSKGELAMYVYIYVIRVGVCCCRLGSRGLDGPATIFQIRKKEVQRRHL